ncbi:L,D-transpeptidase family protein [Caulobacter sp. KR2-114]|uniref:L,D-transpeptidase family protein n=1 Tax=Caulobacter sp. KR2-114 TaxID=3400912 RepID=UPI003BFF0D13
MRVLAFAATVIAVVAVGGASCAAAAFTPDDVAALVAAARAASADGLPAPDLATAARDAVSPDPTQSSLGEASLVAGATDLAALSHGRLARPAAVNREWALKAPYDAAADVAAALGGGRIAAWAGQLRPSGPAYLSLAALRTRYVAIVAAGGWAAVGPGPTTPPGGKDPRVPLLRARLAAEGYDAAPPEAPAATTAPPAAPPAAPARPAPGFTAPVAPDPNLLDPGLAAALASFQANHALPQTGALDGATQAALDAPAAARLQTIDLNLERERWMPASPPPARIEVDIASQTLTLFQAGRPALAMKVVVGRADRRTPSFASATDGVVFNPPWVVPGSIAAKELYPHERRTPGYLARNGFSVIRGQLVQAPGPRSSLGAVKIDMPSPFGVYLHDTPARALFARPQRTFSHGCIRLEAPRELAAALLAAQGWSRADIDAAIAAKATRRVALAVHTPVFVVYRTAAADASGRLQARPDVYGWDAQLAAALLGPGAAVASSPQPR